MFLVDEDVGHGALVRHGFERVLDCGAVVNLIHLQGINLRAELRERRFRRAAMGAVGFAEYDDSVFVNDTLGFGLCR